MTGMLTRRDNLDTHTYRLIQHTENRDSHTQRTQRLTHTENTCENEDGGQDEAAEVKEHQMLPSHQEKNIKASFPFQPSEGTTEPTLLEPQFQISRLQKCDASNFCYSCHPGSGTSLMTSLGNSWASLIAHSVKNLPAMQETQV